MASLVVARSRASRVQPRNVGERRTCRLAINTRPKQRQSEGGEHRNFGPSMLAKTEKRSWAMCRERCMLFLECLHSLRLPRALAIGVECKVSKRSIAVIGLGYVGLPVAVAFSRICQDVI